MRLVHGALQRLGAELLLEADGRRPASQEAGDCGPSPQDPGALLGDAARPKALARPADGAERPAAALQAASPNGGGTAARRAASSKATDSAGGNVVTQRRH